jgi:hypothetical protein
LGNGYKGHNPEERLPVFAKEEEDLITEAAGSQFSESTESRSLCETLPPEPILVEFTPGLKPKAWGFLPIPYQGTDLK